MAREQRLESFTIISLDIRHVKDAGMISLGLGHEHERVEVHHVSAMVSISSGSIDGSTGGGTTFCDGGGEEGRSGIRCEG